MKFIKKRNFVGGEELLYTPQLHWLYTVTPLIRSLPFFVFLVIVWAINNTGNYTSILMYIGIDKYFNFLIRIIFLVWLLFVLVRFVCRIIIYINTEYGLTNKLLLLKNGCIRISLVEVSTDRIECISCVQGLLGRIFRYGTLCIFSTGAKEIVFKMVTRPFAFRKKLVSIIEKNKMVTVVYGDLPRDIPKPKPVVQEPPYRYGTFVRIPPNSVE
jgi:uncharacterized membrane protein YdbT with pleckstrin-like domain